MANIFKPIILDISESSIDTFLNSDLTDFICCNTEVTPSEIDYLNLLFCDTLTNDNEFITKNYTVSDLYIKIMNSFEHNSFEVCEKKLRFLLLLHMINHSINSLNHLMVILKQKLDSYQIKNDKSGRIASELKKSLIYTNKGIDDMCDLVKEFNDEFNYYVDCFIYDIIILNYNDIRFNIDFIRDCIKTLNPIIYATGYDFVQ